MVRALDEDQIGSLASRQNVLPEVWPVDRVPDCPGRPLGGFVGEGGVLMEIGFRLLERGGPEEKESLNVPAGMSVSRAST